MRLRWDGSADRLGALLAAAIVAWATVSASLLLNAIAVWPTSPIYMGGPIPLFFIIIIPGFAIAAVVTAIVGWPVLMFAERVKLTLWWQAGLIGLVAGLITGLAVTVPWMWAQESFVAGGTTVVFAVAGLLAGLTVWITRRRALPTK